MRRAFLFALALALFPCALIAASPPKSQSPSSLQPDARQILIARTVSALLRAEHYPAEKFNSTLGNKVLHEYLNTLDPGHFFFTEREISNFHKQFDPKLGGDLRHGNVEPAYKIYEIYAKNVEQKIHEAISLLNKEPSFTSNQTFQFNRRHIPWPHNKDDLDQLWKQRVKADALSLVLSGEKWTKVQKVLKQRYSYALKNIQQIKSSDVFNTWMNSFAQAEDPHSSYFSPFQAQQFNIEMSLQLEGIGAQLTDRNGYATIVRIIPGGPAAKNGKLRPGDRITGVAQGRHGKMVDVIGWRLDDVVKRVRGHKGTIVRLHILPAGALPGSAETVLTLKRNTIELNAERAKAKTYFVPYQGHSYKIGVITIPSFYVNFAAESSGAKNYTSVTRDVRALLNSLKAQHVAGILLNLRNNGGGSLEQAASLTGLFIPSGPVVQVMNRAGETQVLNTPKGEKPIYTGPLAVLVNRFSASATEIFTGALKDYHRALVLGSRTWGKGTVQTLTELKHYLPGFKAGELKFTIAQFFRVDGASTQRRGIKPDIKLPSEISDQQFGEDSYFNALPWKEIPAAQYTPVHDGVMSSMQAVDNYFKKDIESQRDYQLFARHVASVRAAAQAATISLNLEKRKETRKENQAKKLAYINAWRHLDHKPPFKTLKEADKSSFSPPNMILRAGSQLLASLIAHTRQGRPAFAKQSESQLTLLCSYYPPGSPVLKKCATSTHRSKHRKTG